MIRFGKLEVTAGFLLLAAWLNYLDHSFLILLAMLACAAHELGHYAAIRLLGGNIRLIRFTVIGAEMVLDRTLGYWQEGLSALAGPGINLLLALIFCHWSRGFLFAGLNLALAFFNLLPVRRLDGGRALYCVLALLANPDLAGRIGDALDCLCTAVCLGMGLALACFRGNITLLLTALWLASAFFCQNFYVYSRNSTCQQGRKKVQ